MKNCELRKTSSLVILIWIILIFLLNISNVVADDQPTSILLTDPIGYSNNVYLANNLTISPYVSQITVDTANISWNLDYEVTQTLEVSSDVSVIALPNNRIGIKYPNSSFYFLPEGSTIRPGGEITVLNPDNTVISVPEWGTIVNVPYSTNIYSIDEIDDFNLITNATFTQSIDSLDKYKVKTVLNNLYSTDLSGSIKYYSVDWGDGSGISIYNPTQINPSHVYKNSGTYTQKFYITDAGGLTYNFTQNYTILYEGDLTHAYLVIKEYKEPIAATSTGIGSAALLGFALTETGKYKFLSLLSLLIPMYTHIQKDDVLDQFVRGEIYGLVKSNPGVHYNEIMRKLDMKNGTLSYHLHMLEKTEMIKSRREGVRYRAFYPTGLKFPQEERYRLSDLQLEILRIIKENEGIQQKEIAKKLDKKPQTVNYNVKILQQADLIKVRKKGRETSCYILGNTSDNQNATP